VGDFRRLEVVQLQGGSQFTLSAFFSPVNKRHERCLLLCLLGLGHVDLSCALLCFRSHVSLKSILASESPKFVFFILLLPLLNFIEVHSQIRNANPPTLEPLNLPALDFKFVFITQSLH